MRYNGGNREPFEVPSLTKVLIDPVRPLPEINKCKNAAWELDGSSKILLRRIFSATRVQTLRYIGHHLSQVNAVLPVKDSDEELRYRTLTFRRCYQAFRLELEKRKGALECQNIWYIHMYIFRRLLPLLARKSPCVTQTCFFNFMWKNPIQALSILLIYIRPLHHSSFLMPCQTFFFTFLANSQRNRHLSH